MLKRVGAVAYELELPSHTRIDPVFLASLLVSLLKKFAGPSVSVTSSLRPVDDYGQFMLEPVDILGCKVVKRDNLPVTQIRLAGNLRNQKMLLGKTSLLYSSNFLTLLLLQLHLLLSLGTRMYFFFYFFFGGGEYFDIWY